MTDSDPDSDFIPPTIEELQEKFPQYDIEGFIAQGGMGAVYLARQISLDRPVAIKILPQEFGEDADYRASFETEAKAMARLNHTNLVGIYDFGEINDMLFIVMEYVPGRTLFDTANGQQVDEKEAARLISDMSEGLAHAHEAGMLHRDIKPANVLIDAQAKPKIVDFGLARPMGEEQTEGVVFGTPGYTAPEVLNNPYAVDHRSDIFSMGVMLYELLTGHLPGKPFVPVSRDSQSDPRFDAIITKSIHPNPAMRYGSANQLSKDLNALIENFDRPLGGLSASPGPTAVGYSPLGIGVGSVVSQLGKTRPTVLPSAKKKSNTGLIIFVILLLAVAAVVAIIISKSESEGPTAEQIAKIEAAKKLEEQQKQELEEERKRYAKKQRMEKKAREEERQREEKRLARLEKEKREAEQALREEEERKKREALARMQAEKEALEKERKEKNEKKLLSDFAFDDFLNTQRIIVKGKLSGLQDKSADLLDPVFDRMERELKRVARRFAKGKRGELLQDLVERYVEDARKAGRIIEIPRGVPEEIETPVNEILREYKEKIVEAVKPLDNDKEDIRKYYVKTLKDKQSELLKDQDKVGAEILDDPINSVKTLEDFKKIFE